jgi:hypothetical protein
MDQFIDAGALLRVVVVSLLLGTSIPAVFALGVRVLAWDGPAGSRPAIRTAAGLGCFGLVAAAVVLGVLTIFWAK